MGQQAIYCYSLLNAFLFLFIIESYCNFVVNGLILFSHYYGVKQNHLMWHLNKTFWKP